MSAHQSQACCSVPPVVSKGYQQKGEYTDIAGLKTYVTGSSSAKATSAILVVYDIFGYFPQTIQGADILAKGDSEHEHIVFMPDWFKGQPFSHEDFDPSNPEKKQKLNKFFETTGNIKTAVEKVPEVLEAMRAKYPSIKSFSAVGFCWGGKVVAVSSQKYTQFKSAASVHPSMVDPEEAKNIAIPFALLPSKDEDEQLVDKFAANLKEKHLVEKFPTQPHGWMAARANLEESESKKEYERGYKTLLDFFHTYA